MLENFDTQRSRWLGSFVKQLSTSEVQLETVQAILLICLTLRPLTDPSIAMVFPFLSLPLEIRLPIYRYALPYSVDHSNSGDLPGLYQNDWSRKQHRPGMSVAECPVNWFRGTSPFILYLNHQIYEESCKILYQENTFSFYVKHPRDPRLPMNESRADEESFILISWWHRSWSHPRNPRLPLSIFRSHIHVAKIRNLHVSLPDLRDLIGVDMWMRTTSYASHHGIGAWIDKVLGRGGALDEAEAERMSYVQKIKGPVDEVAQVLRTLPRIDQLVIIFQSERYEIAFIEHVASQVLQLRGIKHAQCLYRHSSFSEARKLREDMMAPRTHDLEQQLQSPPVTKAKSQGTILSAEAVEMLHLLQAMQNRLLCIRELRAEFMDSRVDTTLPLLNDRDIMGN